MEKHTILKLEAGERNSASGRINAALFHILRSLTDYEDLGNSIQVTVDRVGEALRANQVYLCIIDTVKRQVTHFFLSGPGINNLKEPSYEEAEALCFQLDPFTSIGDGITAPIKYQKKVFGYLSATPRTNEASFITEEEDFLRSVAIQIGVAVENARLSLTDRRFRKQTEALRELSRILTIRQDQKKVLEFVLDQLAQVIEYDSAAVMLLAQEKLSIAAQRKFHNPEKQLKADLYVEKMSHVLEVMEQRQVVIIPDTTLDNRWMPFPMASYIRCWMGVPLIERERVIGLLAIDKEQPNYYTQDDAEIALIFANQAAIAIENTRLYTMQFQRLEQLDALYATIGDISSELELPKLLRSILERATVMLDATGGDIGLYDERRQEITILVSHNMGKDYAGTHMVHGEGAMGRAVQTLEPIIIEDYANWDNASVQFKSEEIDYHAVLAVPFTIAGRVVGAIGVVDSRPEQRFSSADQYLLTLFAQHAAIAVENARLYQSAREAAERRSILHQVSQEIVRASLDSEGIYKAIHNATARLMPAEAFFITLYHEAKQEFEAVYLIDRSGRVPGRKFAREGSLSGQVIETDASVYFEDTGELTKAGFAAHFGDPEEVLSVLAVPMRLRGKVVGVLSTQSYKPNAYTPEDKYLLEMLATYAAIALDNARLFQEIQQLAITDALTQIYNRRHLFELGHHEYNRTRRFHNPLSTIMLDIDHFKQINDTYSHATGDHVLFTLAQLMKKAVRDTDIVGRYGGEEFVVVLSEADAHSAYEVAERIRKSILETFNGSEPDKPAITVSIGVSATSDETTNFNALINQADTAMYAAKGAGRNRVEIYKPSQD